MLPNQSPIADAFQSGGLPAGTVTFLFTDIEGSTKRWEHLPQAMEVALIRHDAILRSAIENQNGRVFKTIGDAFCAAFADPAAALLAAVDAQRALAAEAWGEIGSIRARMALHSGAVEPRAGDYFGPPVNRVARILSTGYGEQVLVSTATATAGRDRLPPGASLLDLGAHRLKDLLQPEHIYQLVVPGLTAEFPPIKSLDRQPHNLPAQSTSLIGRHDEVAHVRELLTGGTRLVTLTGPGGTGKTRLALQAAADLIDAFADGAWFVGLSPLADPSLVVPAIAQVLGVRESGHESLEASLLDDLRHKKLLLLLDNFEHLLAAVPIVGRILAACPGVSVLATSRATLQVYGEREVAVLPLALPNPKHLPALAALGQVPAVELFVERARAAKAGFALTEANAEPIAAICARLDGLPLAIELAAVRVKLFPPATLLTRLENRLNVLTGGGKDRELRQQTLRDAIAWSFDLLDTTEQRLFRRFAVFTGGCSFEAAETVLGGDAELDLFDGLASLVDKSLLRQEELPSGEPRFFMLETIREFALEKLHAAGEAEGVKGAHAAFYRSLLESAEERDDQTAWAGQVEQDLANVREAVVWTTAGNDPTRVLALSDPLRRFAHQRGHIWEVRDWLKLALERSANASAEFTGRALIDLGDLAASVDDLDEARTHYEASLRVWRELNHRSLVAVAVFGLGSLARDRGEYAAAMASLDEALAVFRELGDREGEAFTLDMIGETRRLQGDFEAARAAHAEALALIETFDDPIATAYSYHALGRLACHLGDTDEAEQLLGRSRKLYEDAADPLGTASVLHTLGWLALHRGELGDAAALLAQALEIRLDQLDRMGIAESMEQLARAIAPADPHAAVRWTAFAARQRDRLGRPLPPCHAHERDDLVASLRAAIDERAYAAAWTAGEGLTPQSAAAEALATVRAPSPTLAMMSLRAR
jgi:predicted ATPase/class 3 adenylate cyclase